MNSCVLITSPITVKKKTGCVACNQPGCTKPICTPIAGRLFPYGLLTSLYPWDSAAVSIVFMGAAPARATPSPTSRRGSLYCKTSRLTDWLLW
eukprot:COSAG02_NODE_400_length_23094_cov_309.555990_14_plen_93_part_00